MEELLFSKVLKISWLTPSHFHLDRGACGGGSLPKGEFKEVRENAAWSSEHWICGVVPEARLGKDYAMIRSRREFITVLSGIFILPRSISKGAVRKSRFRQAMA